MSAAIEAGGRQAALLESLINLCRPLGIQTIAQGIETAGQLAALRQLGFEMGQGPLFSPQVNADAARNLIALTHWPFTPLARATSGAESSVVIA
jgi:EAL domain-containing protein (putative c-di-GMP-specific phosphodiesterase class I)